LVAGSAWNMRAADTGEVVSAGRDFKQILVDSAGPRSAWAKAVGDIDGDGRLDLLVGGREGDLPAPTQNERPSSPDLDAGRLVWYRNPDWKVHLVSTDFTVRTDLEVGDIDGDGRNDLVIIADTGVFWLRNPDWKPVRIDDLIFHDVELADLDGDGDLDVIARDQGLFNHFSGDVVHVYLQETPERWLHRQLTVPRGEGLVVADMDADGRPDIVVNSVWLRNPGAADGVWQPVNYAGNDWAWPDLSIATGDFNGDGRRDIVVSP